MCEFHEGNHIRKKRERKGGNPLAQIPATLPGSIMGEGHRANRLNVPYRKCTSTLNLWISYFANKVSGKNSLNVRALNVRLAELRERAVTSPQPNLPESYRHPVRRLRSHSYQLAGPAWPALPC